MTGALRESPSVLRGDSWMAAVRSPAKVARTEKLRRLPESRRERLRAFAERRC